MLPLLVRCLALWPAVLVGGGVWDAGDAALGAVVAVGVLLAAHLVTLVPRLTIEDEQLVLRRLLSVDRLDLSTLSLQLVPARVLHYRTWTLLVDGGASRQMFSWISWARHDLMRPWSAPTPPPRAQRFAADVETALQHAADSESRLR
jgi:hypothetical protein